MDFVDCLIHLNDNRLTEFSSTVYQPVLEAMYRSNLISPHRGAVYIDYSKAQLTLYRQAFRSQFYAL